MFEEATKLKLRFTTARGNISVEDVWDLPLLNSEISLDNLAKFLYQELEDEGKKSFVVKKNKVSHILELKFNIVKHIIQVRLDEIEEKELLAENKAKKDKILGILSDKEDESLRDMSESKLKKMVKDLQALQYVFQHALVCAEILRHFYLKGINNEFI